MYDPIYIYVPEMKQIIKIAEGSGDNLLDEDIEVGYVDYIYYDKFVMDPHMREIDGGMVMLTELFQNKFRCTYEAIPSVLDMAYGRTNMQYILLD